MKIFTSVKKVFLYNNGDMLSCLAIQNWVSETYAPNKG